MPTKNPGREKLEVPSNTRATSCSNLNTHTNASGQRRHTCTATEREEQQDLLDNLSISIQRVSLTSELEGVKSNTQEGEPFVKVTDPTIGTRWIRGQSAAIKWNVLDPTVERVAIMIMSEGSSATTVVTNSTPNDGIFTYLKVPWGMECGTKYFLRFTNVQGLLRSFTTKRFEIGSAP
uniref:Uncharacterized protein AlNc14C46G3715 n=1 Tax=Albugo laibachii Nc14 TaxID=890382 RepID=F0WAJ1_9STRA|nr:conserved hypothetical protein [Albugo laibachii Nc14]|eukprot:CCA18162.1 conserved hypothetical protein [Albugo laibachii Nc14]